MQDEKLTRPSFLLLVDSTQLACTRMGLNSVLVLSHNLEVTNISACRKKEGCREQVKEMSLRSYPVGIYCDTRSLLKKVLIHLIWYDILYVVLSI